MEGSPSAMDWRVDTPPKVLYHSKRPFSHYARDESVEYGRSGTYIHGSQSPHLVSTDYSSAFGSIGQHANTEQVDWGKVWPWSYMLSTRMGNTILKIITHPVNRASWRTVYGTARSLCRKLQITDKACIAIEQAADGAKRRFVQRTIKQAILVSGEENQLWRYRARLADCRKHERSYSKALPNTAWNHVPDSPDGEFYMSGALMDDDSNGHSTQFDFQPPGSWPESPETDPSRYYHYTPYTPSHTSDAEVPEENDFSSSAWPYFGYEHDAVELNPMDIEDESTWLPEDSSDPASSNNSNPLDQEDSDMDISDTEDTEQPNLDPLSHSKYGWYNPDPDAVQRAAADEFDAILADETNLSCDILDQDQPVAAPKGFHPSPPDQLVNSPILSQSPRSNPIRLFETSNLHTPDPSVLVPSSEDSPTLQEPSLIGTLSEQSVQRSLEGEFDHEYHQSPLPHPFPCGTAVFPQPIQVAKEQSPRKRVAFYVSPKTGKPVDRFKKYIKGESMDVSYVSTSTDEGFSIHSDTSPSVQLYYGPTHQEQMARQMIIEKKDQDLLRSLAEGPIIEDVPSLAPLPIPPRPLAQITNVRARQRRGVSSFAVTEEGSPMRLRSSSGTQIIFTNSPGERNQALGKGSPLGKENDNPHNHVSASADSSVNSLVYNGDSTYRNIPQGSLTHGTESSSRDQHLPPSQANQAAMSTSTNSASVRTLEHGKDHSSKEKYSPSTQIDASDLTLDAPATSSPLLSDETITNASLYSSRPNSPSSQLFFDDSEEQIEISSNAESVTHEETLATGKDTDCPSEDLVTPSTQIETSDIASDGDSLVEGTLVNGKDSTPAKNGRFPANQVDAPATPPTPNSITRQLDELTVSGRRSSTRHATKLRKEAERRAAEEARLAAERARKEKEEAEERARKEEERRKNGARRMPVESVIQPLSREWETRVDKAMGESMGRKVASSRAGTDIFRRDIGKVLPQSNVPGEDPRGWLNDTIIQAYIDTAVNHALEASGHRRNEIPKMVSMSTYFYPKLDKEGAEKCDRWTKRAKVGGKQMKDVERIFIPVNVGGMHWTLLVVSPKFKTIEYFDSFHGSYDKVIKNAKAWVQFNLKGDFVEDEWTMVGIGGPVQTNGSDCGVFTSTTAKMITLGVDPMAYDAGDIPTQRRRMVAEILNGGFTGELQPNVVFGDE